MNDGNATATAPKTPPPKVGNIDPTKATSKVSIDGVRAATVGKDGRYIIGRKTVGESKGLSAWPLGAEYKPDLGKLPAEGSAQLTVDANGYVVGIAVSATL